METSQKEFDPKKWIAPKVETTDVKVDGNPVNIISKAVDSLCPIRVGDVVMHCSYIIDDDDDIDDDEGEIDIKPRFYIVEDVLFSLVSGFTICCADGGQYPIDHIQKIGSATKEDMKRLLEISRASTSNYRIKKKSKSKRKTQRIDEDDFDS